MSAAAKLKQPLMAEERKSAGSINSSSSSSSSSSLHIGPYVAFQPPRRRSSPSSAHSADGDDDAYEDAVEHVGADGADTADASTSHSSSSSSSAALTASPSGQRLKGGGEQQHDPSRERPVRRYGCWGACSGCYLTQAQYALSVLLLASVLLVLLLLLTFLGIVPAVISSAMGSARLSLADIRISQPSADRMQLNCTLRISHAGAFDAQLHATTVSVSQLLADGSYSAQFGRLELAPLLLSGDTTAAVGSAFLVTDSAAFDSFMRSLLAEAAVTWHLSASASVTPLLGGLQLPTYSSVALEKDVTVAGCGGLNQSSVDAFSLLGSNLTHVNLALSLTLLNPSEFSIASLGRLHFRLLYLGQYIGDVYDDDAPLLPGNNSLSLHGSLARGEAQAEQRLVELFLTGQTVTVSAEAASDASSIPLFNAGMQGLTLQNAVPGNTMPLVRRLEFLSLELRPSEADASAQVHAAALVSINSPLGLSSPLSIASMAVDCEMLHAGQSIGRLVSAASAAFPVYDGNSSLTLTFRTSIAGQLRLSGNGSAYAAFASAFISAAGNLSMSIVGSSNITAAYALGNISASALPVTANFSLPGLQGLSPVEQGLTVNGPLLCAAPPCGLNVTLAASMLNPSFVTISLSRAALAVLYEGEQLGTVQAAELSIRPGRNALSLSGALLPVNDSAVVSSFIDAFIHARPVTVQLRGDAAGLSNASALALTTAALALDASVPGQNCSDRLISSIALSAFSIEFSGSAVLLSTLVRAAFALPVNLQMPLSIASTSLSAVARLNASSRLGSLSALHVPVQFEHRPQPPDFLNMSLVQTQLSVSDDDVPGFQAFASQLLLSTAASFTLSASASPTADTPLGPLSLSAIDAQSAVTLRGLNRFVSAGDESLLTISPAFDIADTTPHYLLVNATVSITNPSNVSLSGLGSLTLELCFNGSRIGRVQLRDFALPLGTRNHSALANISRPTAATEAALVGFISAMINQSSSAIELHGGLLQANGSLLPGTDIPLLQSSIAALITPSSFPGLQSPLIRGFKATISSLQTLIDISEGKGQLPTQLYLSNPFSVRLLLQRLNISVRATGHADWGPFGSWQADISADPIIVEPNNDWRQPTRAVFISLALSGCPQFCELVDIAGSFPHLQLPIDTAGSIDLAIAKTVSSPLQAFQQRVSIDSRNVTCAIEIDLQDAAGDERLSERGAAGWPCWPCACLCQQ